MVPTHLDLKKDRGLTVEWEDGTTTYFSIPLLRRMSPSADMRELRQEMAANPLTVLPSTSGRSGPITALDASLAGNYGIKITFSDGHSTGIFTWEYLKTLAGTSDGTDLRPQ